MEQVQQTSDVEYSSNITLSARYASHNRTKDIEITIAPLLPLLRNHAHSVATIKHVMNKIRETVAFLNPGQTPIITADQPLYALAKHVQWHCPDEYGEDKFVIMFGGLHIEMTAMKSIGSILEDSGWTCDLVEASVASSSTADSFLSATNVTRTRQARQITACSLFQLMKKAYSVHLAEHLSNDDKDISFENWCGARKKESPQFQFWSLVLNIELPILTLIRSYRKGNFTLYRESLSELILYFFANNNINYARWLPIHLET